jgi:oxygen-independent coproporphyrinogen-3 oxidase
MQKLLEKVSKNLKFYYPKSELEVGLYLHYPFCQAKCPYCHFNSYQYNYDRHLLWLSELKREIELLSRYLSEHLVVKTLYFGGGTPSLIKAEEIILIQTWLREGFRVELVEATLEIHPSFITSRVENWLEAGLTRLSLGVQSFDRKVLSVLKRAYYPEEVELLVEKIRQAGCSNLNLDLIIGVPGESTETMKSNLDFLNRLEPEHVSVYLLEELENGPFGRIQEKDRLSEEQLALTYERYRVELERLGWVQYEISNFSRPGFQCLHNLKYWEYQPFLGLGPAAASHLSHYRWQNPLHPASWLDLWKRAGQSGGEFLELKPLDCLKERVTFGLRLRKGINWDQIRKEYPGLDFSPWEKNLQRLIELGLLVREEQRLKIPADKILISNSIIADLLP